MTIDLSDDDTTLILAAPTTTLARLPEAGLGEDRQLQAEEAIRTLVDRLISG
jgi:hypothetical protein